MRWNCLRVFEIFQVPDCNPDVELVNNARVQPDVFPHPPLCWLDSARLTPVEALPEAFISFLTWGEILLVIFLLS